MNSLKQHWHNYISSGMDLAAGSPTRTRTIFINIFSLISFVTELSFGILNLASQHYGTAAIEILAALVILINLILLRRHHLVNRAALILITAIAVPLMTMLLTTSAYNTSIVWLPTFPVAAYLILGKKQGSTALFILFITIGAISLLEWFNLVEFAYTFLSVRQMIISLLVLTVLLYVHENLREQSELATKAKTSSLRNAYKKVRKAEEARDEYIQTVTHELQNSLVAIQKLAETQIDQNHSLSPKQSFKYMRLIHQSATDSLALSNSLLDIMNIDRANFTVKKSLHNLKEIVDHQIALFEPQAQTAGLSLTKVYDDEVPWQLPIDSFRIKEVVTNLLSNAMKHTASGNTITIQVVKATNQNQLHQRAKQLGVKWYISPNEKNLQNISNFVFLGVSHPEAGINKKDIGKLFNKFSRLPSSDPTQTLKGHGLGLYIIRRIIESHNGTYGAASRAGQGVTFYVTLPINSNDQSATNHPSH